VGYSLFANPPGLRKTIGNVSKKARNEMARATFAPPDRRACPGQHLVKELCGRGWLVQGVGEHRAGIVK